ncbi:hypothetical protein LA366_02740 [Aeromonas jandaei]|uniref:DUF1640 domain-containing protein n=1 Tax=Aeromonas jandaei TaxID=650 RepID=A0A7T4A8N8_AERJA|nr:hypothetical protein [Aeromonas jandaei]QQB19350.1 hypothetical protein I6H43_17795 [Aeromonas jandaei]UCA34026.1 hypothetical protein LA366_02740 [Aeromonas jandaei]
MNTSPRHTALDSDLGVLPRQEGTPSRGGDNAQLQWVIESITQLKASHEAIGRQLKADHESLTVEVRTGKESLATSIEHKLELLKTTTAQKNDTIDAKISAMDERLIEKHRAIEERIIQNHSLLMAKIENAELKVGKAHSDARFDTMKWVIGLAVAFPSVAWMVVQLFNNFSKT